MYLHHEALDGTTDRGLAIRFEVFALRGQYLRGLQTLRQPQDTFLSHLRPVPAQVQVLLAKCWAAGRP